MQPVQPYTLTPTYNNYPNIPVQNRVPNKTNLPLIPSQMPAITPPLSGIIAPPAGYPKPTIEPKVPVSTPPLSGIIAPPVDYPKPTVAVLPVYDYTPPALAGIISGPSIDDMFSTPSNIRLTKTELEPIQQDLYNKKQYQTLAKMNESWDYSLLYGKVKDNKDFNELLNSKVYQGKDGFFNILETLRTLTNQRQKAIKTSAPTYPMIVTSRVDYKKYYINDYLKIINNFVKSPNYSDDLKAYYLNTEGKKLDSYYGNLDSISKVVNPMDALINKQV